jgi:hypothetical protein
MSYSSWLGFSGCLTFVLLLWLRQIGCSGNRTANGRTVISEVWYYGHHVGKPVRNSFHRYPSGLTPLPSLTHMSIPRSKTASSTLSTLLAATVLALLLLVSRPGAVDEFDRARSCLFLRVLKTSGTTSVLQEVKAELQGKSPW